MASNKIINIEREHVDFTQTPCDLSVIIINLYGYNIRRREFIVGNDCEREITSDATLAPSTLTEPLPSFTLPSS